MKAPPSQGWHQLTILHGKYGIPMRLHNLISYGVTLLAFPAVALVTWRDPLARLPEHPAFALGISLWTLHFVRRFAECLWVHHYSKPAAPWVAVLLEYLYYWGQGAFIAHTLAAPSYVLPALVQLAPGITLFLLGETGNAWHHWRLGKLRSPGETTHRIPQGGLFRWVSSPHYLCEILAWWGFALALPCLGTLLFASLTTAILINWGLGRQRSYLREFDGLNGRALYPKVRRALIPFVL